MNYQKQIRESEEIISRLHKKIHSTFELKKKSKKHEEEWKKACSEFHEKYDQLYFLDGINDYREELRRGNKEAIEYAITFIELRPYFFRSGYMFKDLLRVLKNCNLSKTQRRRHEEVQRRFKQYKDSKNK